MGPEGSSGTPLAAEGAPVASADLGPPVLSALLFPGYRETRFSTAEKRYFYKGSKRKSELGSGSQGVVEQVDWYNPETCALEVCVAKTLKVDRAAKDRGDTAGGKADGLRESQALQWVAGVPGVVGYRDTIMRANGGIVIVMEDAPGVELSVRMEDRDCHAVGLSWRDILAVLRQIAQALAECHRRGLVHGDIKPDNINNSADKTLVTLIDFGTASMYDGDGWEYVGGTIAYSAPELLLIARSKRVEDAPPLFSACSPAIDCWAYGLTALQLLTACRLFAVAKDACPSDIDPESEDGVAWSVHHTANLHTDWEESSESGAIHDKFRDAVEQLAGVSEDFKRDGVDFLRALLHPNPAERLTAEQALLHPFLVNDFPTAALDTMPPAIEKKKKFVIETTLDQRIADFCVKLCLNPPKDDDDDDDDDDDEDDSDEDIVTVDG